MNTLLKDNDKINRYQCVADMLFKIIFLIYTFVTYCNITYASPIKTPIIVLTAASAVICALSRLIKWRDFIKTTGLFFVIAIMCSYILSMLLNRAYGLTDSAKYLVWLVFFLFLLFVCDYGRSPESYKKEFEVISVIFTVAMFVMSFASIIEMICKYGKVVYFQDGSMLIFGLTWGRLWGVFYDPNYASVFAVIAIIFSFYWFNNVKHILLRILLVINCVLQLIYISFSDSRTGVVVLFVSSFLYIAMNSVRKYGFKAIGKQVTVLALALVISVSPVCIKYINNVVQEVVGSNITSIEENTKEDEIVSGSEVIVPSDNKDIIVGREDDLEGNFSNRRFDLWKSAVEIFKLSPIYGVSFFNLVDFAKKNTPTTYLISSDAGIFNNFHNAFFNILVGQGIIGILIVAAFALFCFINIIKNYSHLKDSDITYVAALFSIIIASIGSAMSLTDILYANSPTSFVFWLFLGYLMHILKIRSAQSSDVAKGEN